MTTGLAPRREGRRAGRTAGEVPPARRVAAALGLVVWACLLAALCSATIPAAWGWTPRVVLSGSMEPAISSGDVAMIGKTDPAELHPGDVVLADLPGSANRTYLHRVVEVEAGRIVTRGDANPSNDYPAVGPSAVQGRVRLIVPLVGWPLLWVAEPSPLRSAAAVLLLLLLLASFVAMRPVISRTPRRGARRTQTVSGPPALQASAELNAT